MFKIKETQLCCSCILLMASMIRSNTTGRTNERKEKGGKERARG